MFVRNVEVTRLERQSLSGTTLEKKSGVSLMMSGVKNVTVK